MLNEVVVSGRNPRELVEEAIRKIPANYSTVADRLTGFYRETSRKRRRYINIAEAVIDLHKTPYTQDASHDRVRILKGRRLLSPKASDTLAVKLLGGPNASIYLDVVKNPDLLLSPEVLPCYDFHFEEPTAIDQRPQYVVSFTPNRKLPYALYYGKFYIDKERLSFTRAEFFLDTSDRYKATQAILHSKPFGLRFKPVEVAYQVNYTDHDGKTYLSYVRNELRFKCDWRRRLFSTSYAVVSEMVVTDIKPSTTDIPIREAFGKDQILSDDASLFFDKGFWGNYNIIKLECKIRCFNIVIIFLIGKSLNKPVFKAHIHLSCIRLTATVTVTAVIKVCIDYKSNQTCSVCCFGSHDNGSFEWINSVNIKTRQVKVIFNLFFFTVILKDGFKLKKHICTS